MGKLGEDSRNLIRRRYESEHSIRDISKEMQKKEGAIKTALFRIRQVLRRCVEGMTNPQAGLTGA
jgi:DNA-directed RNA polymerase specialized sigma24 family protein